MNKTLLVIFALCFASAAQASGTFKGNWEGTGSAGNFDGSWQSSCDPMTLTIEQTESSFSILKGEFICGQAIFTLEPMSLEIRGSLLYSQGYQVGTVAEDKVEFAFTGTGLIWRIMFESKNGVLHFKNVYDGGTNGSSVEGDFIRR